MEMAENKSSEERGGMVRVTNLLPEHNEVSLKEMFAKFGEVKIIMDKNSSCAFATFQDFDTAVMAVNFFRVGINFDNYQKKTNYFSIQSLNDDCILHIILFLSVEDKLNLSKTSQRFLSLCGISFRISNKPLLNYGDELKIIDGYFSSGDKKIDMRALKFVPKLCANLKVLTFRFRHYSKREVLCIKLIRKVITYSPNLESVFIANTYLCGTTLDELSNLKNLKMLTLCNVRNDISRNLIKLTNLTGLNLTRSYFKSKYYIQLFKAIKLKTLFLCYCKIITSVINALFKYQTNLEILCINTKYDLKLLNTIKNLSNLKELYLADVEDVNVSLMYDTFFNQSRNKDLKIFISKFNSREARTFENNIYQYYGIDGRKFKIYLNTFNNEWRVFPYDFVEVINITAE